MECAFGEIDLHWGIFWKRINFSLENTALIIEGAMRLHNFFVDHRHNAADTDSMTDMKLFQDDALDSCADVLQTGSDLGRTCGGHPDVASRNDGMRLRLDIANNLQLCDMHRPQQIEWHEDRNTHTQRLN